MFVYRSFVDIAFSLSKIAGSSIQLARNYIKDGQLFFQGGRMHHFAFLPAMYSSSNCSVCLRGICLSLFGLLRASTPDWVAPEQQKLIGHGSGDPPRRSGCRQATRSGEGPPRGRGFLTVSSWGGKCGGALWDLFYKSTNPIPEDFTFLTQSPPTDPAH